MLVTPTAVRDAAVGNVPRLSDAAFLEACVATAEAILEQYLGYPPALHLRRTDPTWYASAAGYYTYPVGTAVLPLNEGVTVNYAGLLSATTIPTVDTGEPGLSYLAGWRGYDANGVAITDAALLSALTAEYGAITAAGGAPLAAGDLTVVRAAPAAIRSALAEAAVAVALRLAPGLVGVERSTVDLGSGSRTTERAAQFGDVNTLIGRTDEITAILASRCARWRHVTV